MEAPLTCAYNSPLHLPLPLLPDHGTQDISDSESEGPEIELTARESDSDSGPESEADEDTWGDSERLEVSIAPLFELPACVKAIQNDLLQGYSLPPKPSEPFIVEPLTRAESVSLQHYISWRRTNGTVQAYNEHRAVLESTSGVEVMSLGRVRILARKIARLEPQQVDMCPKSCLAYTGPYSHEDTCPHVNPKTKLRCGEPRRYRTARGKLKPRAQVTILPVLPSIQALLANVKSGEAMEYRDKCLKDVLNIAVEAKRYSDFANGTVHESQKRHFGLFQDRRDVALALSSDGAQLTMKKQSSTWILIIILLNLPPEIRYHSRNVIINFAIPGPNVPSDIESFIRPLFQELARASQGTWLWDGILKEWFLFSAFLAAFLGDMLGSAKANGFLGHCAVHGDRFSLVQGARSSTSPGSKSQYYPLNPPDTQGKEYNPTRLRYDPGNLPMRKMEDYWGILQRLEEAPTSAERSRISKQTGIAKTPLSASMPGFIHPAFFPLDPFHLFYENCMPWLWDISSSANPREHVHVSAEKLKMFGELVAQAMKTLPPAFSGTVRDPFLKRNSQYKAYEWMAILHWYFLPIGLELDFDSQLLHVVSQFVFIVDYAMSLEPKSESDLAELHRKISIFLRQFEHLYVGDDPEKISRCRLCVFQLIHIPIHIKWFGSIRIGSQATCERTIGEMGHKIKSKKNPFANLTKIIVEKESTRIVELYHPELAITTSPRKRERLTLFQSLRIKATDAHHPSRAHTHVLAIRKLFKIQSLDVGEIQRFGKAKVSDGLTLRSRISEETATGPKLYRWFKYRTSSNPEGYGEAISFYHVQVQGSTKAVVVFVPLLSLDRPFPTVMRGKWPEDESADGAILALELDSIQTVVGIWEWAPQKNIYILQKHPAYEFLKATDLGLEEMVERERDEDDDDDEDENED